MEGDASAAARRKLDSIVSEFKFFAPDPNANDLSRRHRIALELFSTEISFLKSLAITLFLYKPEMLKAAAAKEMEVTTEFVESLFFGLDEIFEVLTPSFT